MASPSLEILIKAKDEATAKLKDINSTLERQQANYRKAGIAMMAAGGVMAAGFYSAMKASARQEAGIKRLSVAMKNMGLSYEDASGELEAWIDLQQQTTSFADDEQRDALASLVRMTGDLTEAQNLLTLAMDIAVGTNRDLESANTLVMYAMGGNWGMLERYIPALKQVEEEEAKWAKLRELFAGQAETYGQTLEGQMKTMEANIGDIKEAIGKLVSDALAPVISKIADWIKGLKDTDPEMLKFITTAGLITSGLLILGGGFMLVLSIIPNMVKGFQILVGWVTAARTSVIALQASLFALVAVAYLAVKAISDVTGNTARMTANWNQQNQVSKLFLDPARAINEIMDDMGLTTETTTGAVVDFGEGLGETTTEAEELQSELGALTEELEAYQNEVQEAEQSNQQLQDSILGVSSALNQVSAAGAGAAGGVGYAPPQIQQGYQEYGGQTWTAGLMGEGGLSPEQELGLSMYRFDETWRREYKSLLDDMEAHIGSYVGTAGMIPLEGIISRSKSEGGITGDEVRHNVEVIRDYISYLQGRMNRGQNAYIEEALNAPELVGRDIEDIRPQELFSVYGDFLSELSRYYQRYGHPTTEEEIGGMTTGIPSIGGLTAPVNTDVQVAVYIDSEEIAARIERQLRLQEYS